MIKTIMIILCGEAEKSSDTSSEIVCDDELLHTPKDTELTMM